MKKSDLINERYQEAIDKFAGFDRVIKGPRIINTNNYKKTMFDIQNYEGPSYSLGIISSRDSFRRPTNLGTGFFIRDTHTSTLGGVFGPTNFGIILRSSIYPSYDLEGIEKDMKEVYEYALRIEELSRKIRNDESFVRLSERDDHLRREINNFYKLEGESRTFLRKKYGIEELIDSSQKSII